MPYRFLHRISAGPYFHIYCRGNNKNNIFLSAHDYFRFEDRLREYSDLEKVEVLAFCLMRNHYHLLLHESDFGSIARLMQRLNLSYAKFFNAKYGSVGHLFQGPYGERAVESDGDLLNVSAYIHNNPRDLGVDPRVYRWSSYSDYLSGLSSWLKKDHILSFFPEPSKVSVYQEFVTSAQNLVLSDLDKPGFEIVKL
jgi:putative transposase